MVLILRLRGEITAYGGNSISKPNLYNLQFQLVAHVLLEKNKKKLESDIQPGESDFKSKLTMAGFGGVETGHKVASHSIWVFYNSIPHHGGGS